MYICIKLKIYTPRYIILRYRLVHLFVIVYKYTIRNIHVYILYIHAYTYKVFRKGICDVLQL